MNIVVSANLVHDGIISGILKLIPDCVKWDNKTVSLYDVYDKLKPRVIIANSSEFTKNHEELVKEYPDTKIVLFGQSYEVKPDLLCTSGHYDKDDVPNTMIHRSANVIDYCGEYADIFSCDISYINTKTKLAPEELELIKRPTLIDVKYRAYNINKLNNSVGVATQKEHADILASTSILLDIDGNWLMNAAFNKCFVLCGVKNSYYPWVKYDNVNEYATQYLGDLAAKKGVAAKAYDAIMNRNTCITRIQSILKEIKEKDLEYYVSKH